MRSPRMYSDCAAAWNEAAPVNVAVTTAETTTQRNRAVFLVMMRFESGSIVAWCYQQ
jgi:hypothetical protein